MSAADNQNPYAPPAALPATATFCPSGRRPPRLWQFSLAAMMALVTTVCIALRTSLATYPWLFAASNTTILAVLAASLVAILTGVVALVVLRRLSHA